MGSSVDRIFEWNHQVTESMTQPTSTADSPASFPSTDLIRLLLKKWWLIAIVSVLTGFGTWLYVRTLPEYFKSTVNCVPPRTDNTGLTGALGGISSTLKDFGLNKLGGKGADAYDFIALLFTRTLRDTMIARFNLAEEYDMVDRTADEIREEFESNLDIDLRPEGNYEISVWSRDPKKAALMAETFVREANLLTNRVQRDEAVKSAEYLEERVRRMDSTISALGDSLAWYSRTYMIFSPLDQAKSAATALASAKEEVLKQETALGLLESVYGSGDPQVRTQKSLVEQLKKQYGQLQVEPGLTGNVPVKDAAGIGISYLRVFAEFEAFSKLKAFLLPTLEQTRLDMNKSTPSLLVVDAPVVAEKKDRPKRALISAGAALGSGILTMLILMIVFAWRRLMRSPAGA